jgi:hypothetical protein
MCFIREHATYENIAGWICYLYYNLKWKPSSINLYRYVRYTFSQGIFTIKLKFDLFPEQNEARIWNV